VSRASTAAVWLLYVLALCAIGAAIGVALVHHFGA
jgi:hypothetical protein